MSLEAQILFQAEQSNVRQYVENSSGDYVTVMVDGNVQVIIKEVKQETQSFDKIRMIAGEIAGTGR